jgi:hypothetical protein
MIIKKIVIVILVLLILYLTLRINENFSVCNRRSPAYNRIACGLEKIEQRRATALERKRRERRRREEGGTMYYDPYSPTVDPSLLANSTLTNDTSNTYLKTDIMNVKASINNSIINLDPNSIDNKNINVGNDIIVRKKFRVKGYNYDIDIPFLRYIKNLPLHFEKDICLGNECINKKHIEAIKGERKINLVTYPENLRKCLGSKTVTHRKKRDEEPINEYVFGARDCTNGDPKIEFVIQREAHDHKRDLDSTHIHQHKINDISHNNLN